MFFVWVCAVFAFLFYVVLFNCFNLNAGFHVRKKIRRKKNFVGGPDHLSSISSFKYTAPLSRNAKKKMSFCLQEERFCARRQYRRHALA